jgi:pyrroloquinoline quinone (PQQ) biosynthesis protein C
MFEIKFRLREHPFYKAWEKGEITIKKLSEYAYYWQRILNEFSISDNWIKNLEKPEKYPTLNDLILQLNNMNSSQLLGAIHSLFKRECLIKFYNFKEDDLIYFDEHMKEEKHINFGQYIYENFANKSEFYYGFEKGQELFYRSLDRFI